MPVSTFDHLVNRNMSPQMGLLWIIVVFAGLLVLATVFISIPWAYKRLDMLLLVFIVLAPFHTIVRGISVENVLLSGWRDILYLGILALWAIGVIRGRFAIKGNPLVLTVLLLNVVGLAQALRADSVVVGVAGFRDIIKYSLLAVVTYGLCYRQPFLLRRIVDTLFAVGVMVVILQIVFYSQNLDYVLRLGTLEPSYRAIGPYYFRRMEAFFGGGPSSLGIYLGVPLVIYIASQQLGQKVPKWWHLGAVLLLIGLIMTLSFSAIIAVGVVYTFFLLRHGGNTAVKLLIPTVLLVIFYALNTSFGGATVGDQEATDFASYLINIFGKALFLDNLTILFNDPVTLFIGRGLALVGNKSFLSASSQTDTMIIGYSDGGWVEFAIQVGAPVVILFLLVFVATFVIAWLRSRRLPVNPQLATWALLGASIVMLSSVHMVPWTRVGMDVNFWVVIGALASVPAVAYRRIKVRLPGKYPIMLPSTSLR